MHDDVAKILVNEKDLKRRIAELGAQISADYAPDSRPLLVCVLKGAYMFLSDLTKEITIPHEVDFMATSAYEGGLLRASLPPLSLSETGLNRLQATLQRCA